MYVSIFWHERQHIGIPFIQDYGIVIKRVDLLPLLFFFIAKCRYLTKLVKLPALFLCLYVVVGSDSCVFIIFIS